MEQYNSRVTKLDQLLEADAALSARMALPPGPLRWVAITVAHSGDSPLWIAAGLAALLWGENPWWTVFGIRTMAATVAGGTAATLLKALFRRQRPAPPIGRLYARVDRHAFPSGHATRIGSMVALLAPILPAWGAALLGAWAGLVCLSRVALQAHFLADVTAGLLIGGLLGLILLLTFL